MCMHTCPSACACACCCACTCVHAHVCMCMCACACVHVHACSMDAQGSGSFESGSRLQGSARPRKSASHGAESTIECEATPVSTITGSKLSSSTCSTRRYAGWNSLPAEAVHTATSHEPEGRRQRASMIHALDSTVSSLPAALPPPPPPFPPPPPPTPPLPLPWPVAPLPPPLMSPFLALAAAAALPDHPAGTSTISL